MKQLKYLFLYSMLLLIFVFVSCSKSNDPSPASTIKLQLSYVDQDGSKVFLKYDGGGKITNVTDGGTAANSQFLDIYFLSNGDIQGAPNGKNPASVKNPNAFKDYDQFVYGKTIVNGNPVELRAIQKVYSYDPVTYNYIITWNEITIKTTFDDKINPLYMVLSQSNALPTLDNLMFSSPNPLYAALESKGLVAMNNPTKVERYDKAGKLLEPATTIGYQYNSDGLPTVAIAQTQSGSKTTKFFYSPK